jgi:hypothetical protein
MKNNKIQFLMGVISLSLTWVGCQKSVSNQAEQNPSQIIKSFGAVQDDATLARNVSLIMSTEFKNARVGVASDALISAKGKPTKPSTGGDVSAPTIKITSPTNGATVSGVITVQVTASDNVGVNSVTYVIDGVSAGTSTSSPFSFSWNADNVADGNHTITATARDAAGNQGSSSVTVAKNTTIVILPPPPSLPSAYQITMPAVGYQGSEGSCVTFAAVYYMRSAEQYRLAAGGGYNFSTNVFSPEFVYNQTKTSSSCASGSSLINTLNFMFTKGVCTWQSMPYTSTDCSLLPTASQITEAANYKIKSYSQILSNDQTAIKTLLSSGHALAFTFTADDNFYTAGPGYIWKAYSSTIYGPHAITLCGYDDAKHAYRAVNQWGTTWGDGGYIWIDYDFFAQITSSAYTIAL